MRAWVIERPGPIGTGPLALRDVPIPEPGPGEVRLRVIACGVCHTDLHQAEGDLPPRTSPTIPGHQVVGVVDAAGPGVATPAIGATVGVTWLAGACGACARCAEGRENLCDAARFTGWDRPGGYAEYVTARADVTAPLPAGLDPFEAAPLLCAGAIGGRALRLAGLAPGMRIGLAGFGASAHLALQLARGRGCDVVVFSRSEAHRARALAMGAERAQALDGEAAPCDAIVTFAPVGPVVPAALRHLRRGGTLAINAVHLTEIPAFPYDLLFGERTVRSVSHVTRADAREILAAAAEGLVRAEVTRVPFERAPEALADVKAARGHGQSVLEIGGGA